MRYKSEDPYEIVSRLDRYSELGALYPVELIKIIAYNRLRRYDPKRSNTSCEAKKGDLALLNATKATIAKQKEQKGVR